MIGGDIHFGQLARDEARSLVALFETDTRKAMVLIVVVEGDQVATVRNTSEVTTRDHARAFLSALDSQREKITAKLENK